MVTEETHRLRAQGLRTTKRTKAARAMMPTRMQTPTMMRLAVWLSQITHSLGSVIDSSASANALQPSGGTPKHAALPAPRQMRVARSYSTRASLLRGYSSLLSRRSRVCSESRSANSTGIEPVRSRPERSREVPVYVPSHTAGALPQMSRVGGGEGGDSQPLHGDAPGEADGARGGERREAAAEALHEHLHRADGVRLGDAVSELDCAGEREADEADRADTRERHQAGEEREEGRGGQRRGDVRRREQREGGEGERGEQGEGEDDSLRRPPRDDSAEAQAA
mmetsp:Transcript_44774/g.145481  ORF Transcript_44774/g.145481 Transcript_44774/m.145481 type:complete len:281 (-) Transcript_44774:979-1821(-)